MFQVQKMNVIDSMINAFKLIFLLLLGPILLYSSTMICPFIDPHIINFTKMSTGHRKLTEEEANLLLETTFLMISKQNLAEKQKYLKNKSTTHSKSLDLTSNSPKKNQYTKQKLHQPQPQPQSSVMNPEKLHENIIQNTSQKFSTDKEESLNDANELSPQPSSKFIEKESNSDHLNDKAMQTPIKYSETSEKMQAESPENQSQIKQEGPQQLYLESQIKQIKRDLQIKSRGKICKSQEINNKTGQVMGYIFYCKNNPNCPFDCSLEYIGERNSKNQKLYKLVVKNLSHIKSCIEEQQEITFLKLTKIIDDMEKSIITLLSQNAELKPKEILMMMAQKLGEDNHKFIYKGLNSKSYHKAAKKYFDNLIYKIKNQMGVI